MMKLACLILVSALVSLSCGPAAKPHVASGRYTKSIKEEGLRRSYILVVPKNYDDKTKLPLVVLFHGWTGSAEDILRTTGFGDKAEKEGFILAVPNGTDGIGQLTGWNTGFLDLGSPRADDVKFTSDILDEADQNLCVDENRVYVAGHSNGAMMAYDLGAKLSDRIAAIGVVSGTVGIPDAHVESPKAPVSAIIFHGKADPTVPYDASHDGLIKAVSAPESAKWWAEKDACGPSAETISDGGKVVIDDYKGGKNATEVEFVTIVNGVHAWPGGTDDSSTIHATDMIWDFFKAHPKS